MARYDKDYAFEDPWGKEDQPGRASPENGHTAKYDQRVVSWVRKKSFFGTYRQDMRNAQMRTGRAACKRT